MKPLTSSYGGTGQFTVQQTGACYTGTADEVNGPFSGHSSVFAYLFGSGWGVSTTFPSDGQTQQPCAAGASCFRSGAAAEYYLSFENLTSPVTGFETYHLRLATPPLAPTCNPTYYGSSVSYMYTFQGYAVPPLTKESDFAAGGGHMGGYTYGLCSAGTPASILAFMQGAVTAAGSTPMSVNATTFHICVSAGSGYYRTYTFAVGSGNEWTIDRSSPVFTTPTC
jgi:hypothetical protein